MKKAKFTIHIGPHKTGTTYIQKCLVENRDHLLREGVFYPEVGQEFYYGHHNLVSSLLKKDYSAISDFMNSIPCDIRNVVISSENFDSLLIKVLQDFKLILEDYEIEVIYYKRNLPALLSSNWQEYVKHGAVATWAEFSIRHLSYPYSSEIMNCNIVLDRYCDVFGIDAVHIVNYDGVLQADDDIAVTFFKLVDANVEIENKGSFANVSLDPAATEIIRVLNQIFANENKLNIVNVREAFFEVNRDRQSHLMIQKLISIINKYNIPFSVKDSYVIHLMNSHFLTRYSENIVEGGSIGNSGHFAYESFPSSNWLCDREGHELLMILKKMVQGLL